MGEVRPSPRPTSLTVRIRRQRARVDDSPAGGRRSSNLSGRRRGVAMSGRRRADDTRWDPSRPSRMTGGDDGRSKGDGSGPRVGESASGCRIRIRVGTAQEIVVQLEAQIGEALAPEAIRRVSAAGSEAVGKAGFAEDAVDRGRPRLGRPGSDQVLGGRPASARSLRIVRPQSARPDVVLGWVVSASSVSDNGPTRRFPHPSIGPRLREGPCVSLSAPTPT